MCGRIRFRLYLISLHSLVRPSLVSSAPPGSLISPWKPLAARVLTSPSEQRVQAIDLTAKSIKSLSESSSTGIVRRCSYGYDNGIVSRLPTIQPKPSESALLGGEARD